MTPSAPGDRPRRRLRWSIALIGVLVVAVAGGLVLRDGRSDADRRPSQVGRDALPSPLPTAQEDAPAPLCGSAVLRGPTTAPAGAVVVRPGDDLAAVSKAHPPGTTFALAAGRHTLGDGSYSQIVPKVGDVYVGLAGAVLDGRRTNRYAFGGTARDVRLEHLTVQGFGSPGENNNEGVVNHDAAPGWRMSHLTVRDNAGAGVLLGSRNVLENSCLTGNGQYGFSSYSPDGVEDLVLRGNEISNNNTDDWERRSPGCGCSGGGKFWATVGALVQGNHVHDNHGVGMWADTNNAGFSFLSNYLADNAGPGIEYETSYNALIAGNTFVRNGLGSWRENPGTVTGALYVSESGADPRVRTRHRDVLDVTRNLFVDNWGGVAAWENSDRFVGSPANTSTGAATLVDPAATLESCSDPDLIRTKPYIDDCRWKTQHVHVHENTFRFDPSALGPDCTTENYCGFNGVYANFGTFPDWSPFHGTVVEEAITFDQDNYWYDNHYEGPWHFMALEQGTTLTWQDWRDDPYEQDVGSTIDDSP